MTKQTAPSGESLVDLPADDQWAMCDSHVWTASARDYDLPLQREMVKCNRCGCPGERDKMTGEVIWPVT